MKNKNKGAARLRSLLFLLLLALPGMSRAYGQTVNTTSTPETAVPGFTNLAYHIINSAVIDYSANCNNPTCGATNQQLKAVVTDQGEISIMDGVSSVYKTYSGFTGDVVLCNNTTPGLSKQYKMGIVYSGGATACGSDIFLDIYNITNVGLGTLAATLSSTTNISPSSGSSGLYPHIDVVSEYGNLTGPGSMPLCRYAAITWVDRNLLTCGGGGANAYYGTNVCIENLNAPVSTPPVTTESSHFYETADVAVVEAFGNAGVFVAYLAMADSNFTLYEWEVDDLTAVSPSPQTLNTLHGSMDVFPRIDAIDNYNANDYSMSGTNNVWMIVDADFPNTAVQGFYGLAANPNNNVSLAFSPMCFPDHFPQVACGPGQNYSVSFYHADGFDDYIATGFSWSGAMSTPSAYWCINSTSGVITGSSGVQNSLSSTCNNDGTFTPTPYLFAVWENQLSYPTPPYIFYKESAIVSSWKHAATAVTTIANTKDWELGPNPAANIVMLSAPDGLKPGQYAYSLSDLSGRMLMQVAIDKQNQPIDIGALAPGLYMLHVSENGQDVKVARIVKE